jgi:peptidase E
LYIGKSAGAIVAGKYVETATWKGWDDPSVVPGKESYDKWKGVLGMDIVGGASIFPHMSDEWVETVQEKTRDTLPSNSDVICLQEFDAFCIESCSGIW